MTTTFQILGDGDLEDVRGAAFLNSKTLNLNSRPDHKKKVQLETLR